VQSEGALLRHELLLIRLRNNEAESSLNDVDSVRLSTSLSLSSADAVATVQSLTTRLRPRAGVLSKRSTALRP